MKICLLGEVGVGKSCLSKSLLGQQFDRFSEATIGASFYSMYLNNYLDTKIYFWDTAGQERYKAICGAHYKRALGALIVYDITNRESFEQLDTYIFYQLSVPCAGSSVSWLLCSSRTCL